MGHILLKVSAGVILACAMIASADAADVTYTYDALGRIIGANYGANGARTFTYDAAGNRTVVETSGVPNRAPLAVGDSIVTSENVAVNFDPRTNDSDPDGDALTISSAGTPSNGTVAIDGAGSSLTYTPATNYIGSDSFTYTISDGNGHAATATVNVTVN